jgi:hypothetical protein
VDHLLGSINSLAVGEAISRRYPIGLHEVKADGDQI